MLQRIGIGASAVHRYSLVNFDKFMVNGAALVRARTLRMAGELGYVRYAGNVVQALSDPDDTCRFWAAYSSVLMGNSTGLGVLREVAEANGPLAERAADLVCRCMQQEDAMAWQKVLSGSKDTLRG